MLQVGDSFGDLIVERHLEAVLFTVSASPRSLVLKRSSRATAVTQPDRPIVPAACYTVIYHAESAKRHELTVNSGSFA
jgi:hypothetical protein